MIARVQLLAVESTLVVSRGDGGRDRRQLVARAAAAAPGDARLGRGLEVISEVEIGDVVGQPARARVLAIAEHRDRELMVGEPDELRAESPRASAMAVRRQAPVLAEGEAGAVVHRLAVGQGAGGQHRGGEFGTGHLVRGERAAPAQQIADGGVELTVAGGGEAEVVDHPEAAAGSGGVAGRAVGHDLLGVLVEEAGGHAQRVEDALAGEGPEAPARDALHDGGEQHVPGVAVGVAFARRVVERALSGHQLDDVEVADGCVELAAGQRHQVEVVAHAAGVMQEVVDGDRRAVVGQLRQIRPDVVAERQRAVERQQHDARGRELLGDRSDVEDGVGGNGDPVVEIREAVPPRVEDLAAPRDPDRTARPGGRHLLADERVDPFPLRGGRGAGVCR